MFMNIFVLNCVIDPINSCIVFLIQFHIEFVERRKKMVLANTQMLFILWIGPSFFLVRLNIYPQIRMDDVTVMFLMTEFSLG